MSDDLEPRRAQRQQERWQANQALLARVHELVTELWGEGTALEKSWTSSGPGPLGTRLEVNTSYGSWRCDEHKGDGLVELVWKVLGLDNERSALTWCAKWLGKQGATTRVRMNSQIAPADKQLDWNTIDETQNNFWQRAGMAPTHIYQARWEYRDAVGTLLFYVCRFLKTEKGGGKLYRKLAYYGPAEGWHLETKGGYQVPGPWPLYGLQELLEHPDAPVLVVEGEKACDAARLLLPQYVTTERAKSPQHVVITWPGGAKAPGHSDWTPLLGRKVTLWPDNDTEGVEAMRRVYGILLKNLTADVDTVMVQQLFLSTSWDFADPLPPPQPNGLVFDPISIIERAHDLPDWLCEMNKKYFIAQEGTRTFIFSELLDPDSGTIKLYRLPPNDFCLLEDNKKVLGTDAKSNPIYVGRGTCWKEHPKRREYKGTIFSPGNDADPDFYNLWRGFSCGRKSGRPRHVLSFIYHVICNGRKKEFLYLLRWLARFVQSPQLPAETAIVLTGLKGIGKSFFATMVGALMEQHFVHISSYEHLTGRFNGFLREVVFLFVDEAFWAGDKKHQSQLQSMITEQQLVYENKGRDPITDWNRLHIMIATNAEWAVPASLDERRYCVLNVSDKHRQDRAYFSALQTALDAGEREQLLRFLLDVDLRDWKTSYIPQNVELGEQKMSSLEPHVAFLMERLYQGDWREEESCSSLHQSYLAYCERTNFRGVRRAANALGKCMVKLFGNQYTSKVRKVGGKVTRWAYLPNIATASHIFKTYGIETDLGSVEDVTETEDIPY